MAGQENLAGVAAKFADVFEGPGDGGGAVFIEAREGYLRVDPIIGHDHDRADAGQRLSGEEIILLVAFLPGAAIEEHDDRCVRREHLWHINIELLLVLIAIGDIAGDDQVPRRDDGVEKIDRGAGCERGQ